ncbi:hypothetical protein KIS4809_5783 [Bacillus sp. ZZV12-4809]|nr:hypothetical protein KIS4809_5783 [Bacillus sp. ZZV12-4809]
MTGLCACQAPFFDGPQSWKDGEELGRLEKALAKMQAAGHQHNSKAHQQRTESLNPKWPKNQNNRFLKYPNKKEASKKPLQTVDKLNEN